MTWFTDSPFERMMVQRPQTRKQEQEVSAVLLTEQDHDNRKQQNKEDEKRNSVSQKNGYPTLN